MTEDQKVWAAAAVDVSSYFSFRVAKHNCISALIRLRRDKPDVPEYLGTHFEMGHYGHSEKTGLYYWSVDGLKVTDFLMIILPYLKVKREQALLLMEFNAHMTERRRLGVAFKKLDDGEKEYRAEILRKMSEMNA